jgi:hypothetical protein
LWEVQGWWDCVLWRRVGAHFGESMDVKREGCGGRRYRGREGEAASWKWVCLAVWRSTAKSSEGGMVESEKESWRR